MNNLGILPSEIISLIISHVNQHEPPLKQTRHLYNYCLINKQFYTTASPLLWQKLQVNDEATLAKIGRGLMVSCQELTTNVPKGSLVPVSYPLLGKHVRHVRFVGAGNNDTMLLRLMRWLPEVETLEIRGAPDITDNSFQQVASLCPNLTTVHLSHVSITAQSIVALGQHLHRLCSLQLTAIQHLSPMIFTALAACPLEELAMVSCRISTDGGGGDMDWRTDLDSSLGLAQLTQLTSLTIDGIYPGLGGFGLRVLQQESTRWFHLTHLRLSECYGISTTQLATFFACHPRITTLQLTDLPTTTNVFTPVADYLSATIESLTLDTHGSIKYKYHSLYQFIQQCPSLTFLALRDTRILSKANFPPGVLDNDYYDDDDPYTSFADLTPFKRGEFDMTFIQKIRQQSDPGEEDSISSGDDNSDYDSDYDFMSWQ